MIYKDSAGKEIHEGDSLMDLTPGFVGEISEVFLDEDEGELAVNQDGTTIYLYEIDTEVSSLIVNEETMNINKEETGGEEKCAVIDTIRYNTGTLEQLRREYSMMRKDSQSTR